MVDVEIDVTGTQVSSEVGSYNMTAIWPVTTSIYNLPDLTQDDINKNTYRVCIEISIHPSISIKLTNPSLELARKDSRARDSIARESRIVDINQNTRIGSL